MLYPRVGPGPFRASQLRDGDRYELSDGHAIYCPPASLRRGQASLTGAGVIDSDPAVPGVAANVGIAFNNDRNLRAPDTIVTADAPPQPGWLDVAPPLAVEYVEPGHDEVDLSAKISELLALGVRYFWVVRLTDPVRVEVHTQGEPVQIVDADETLTAPGVLQNPLPVRALVDPVAARPVMLHNLLQRRGYASFAEFQAEHAAAQTRR